MRCTRNLRRHLAVLALCVALVTSMIPADGLAYATGLTKGPSDATPASGGAGAVTTTQTAPSAPATAPSAPAAPETDANTAPTAPSPQNAHPGAASGSDPDEAASASATLTFALNGGTLPEGLSLTTSVATGKTLDLASYVPTKAGSTFAGWYADSSLTRPVKDPVVMGSEDMTLYAKYDPVAGSVIYVDPVNGSDSHDGQSATTPKKTYAAAFAAVTANGRIIATNLDKAAGEWPLSVGVATKPVTLEIAQDTTWQPTSTPAAGTSCITVNSGSHLTVAPGKTLTMHGCQTAVTILKGGELNDGNYVLDGNAYAFNNKGLVKGSDRSALVIKADSTVTGAGYLQGRGMNYAGGSKFVNADVTVKGRSDDADKGAWGGHGAPLWLENTRLVTEGVRFNIQTWNAPHNLYMDRSYLSTKGKWPTSNWAAFLGDLYYQGFGLVGTSPSLIRNGSTLVVDGGRMTVGSTYDAATQSYSNNTTIQNSTLKILNSRGGGLNLNYGGNVTFENSTFETSGLVTYPAYGVQTSDGTPGLLTFKGSSAVNTPAQDATVDNGGANDGSHYVVTGGSFLIKNAGVAQTVPTNGPENGDEPLTLLTLADPSVSLVTPINANGSTYRYEVGTPTADGQKHVWVPGATVTFKLNKDGATFADGSSADKVQTTVRGYALGFTRGTSDPGVATAADGTVFKGWFYKDAGGAEHPFDHATTKVTSDLEVYAAWGSRSVVYHQGAASWTQSLGAGETTATALGFEDVVAKNPDFKVAGKTFRGWNTAPDGSGAATAPGATLSFSGTTTQIDLYAQLDENHYVVSFSANGGTFADSSVFKTHPEVFDVVKDASGGDVAKLRAQARYDQGLWGLLGGLSHNDLKLTADVATKRGSVIEDVNDPSLGTFYNWYTSPDGTGALRFEDLDLGGGIVVSPQEPKITADTTYYLKWKEDPTVIDVIASGTLGVDLWGASAAATNDYLIAVADGTSTFSLTQAIDLADVKAKVRSMREQFSADVADPSKVALTGTEGAITARLTLPAEVTLPANPTATLVGGGGLFEVTDTQVSGQTVTVTLGLKHQHTNLATLLADASTAGMGGDMRVSIGGLTLKAGTPNGSEFTATSDVSGRLTARGRGSDAVKAAFNFTWSGAQTASGMDVKGTAGSPVVRQTILAKVVTALDLPADLLIDADTENDAAYEAVQGSTVDLTGAVKVTAIQAQMTQIEALYPGVEPSKIALDLGSFGFTATIDVPEGLTLPAGLDGDTSKVTTTGFGDGFKVSSVKVDGNRVTVGFELSDPGSIRTYADLQGVVNAAGAATNTGDTGWMKLTIPGVGVPLTAAAGTLLTATGTVTGHFDAVATSTAGTSKAFAFTWGAAQWAFGRDAVAPAGDTSIRATLKVKAATRDITVRKVWLDEGGSPMAAPSGSAVKAQLMDGAEAVEGATVTLSADNGWTATFSGVPTYRDGREISYSVAELGEVAGFSAAAATGTMASGFTLANTKAKATPPTPAYGDPTVLKRVSGDRPAAPATFSFVLSADDPGNPMPAGSEGGSKTVTVSVTGDAYEYGVEFGAITFAREGTYAYTIRELAGSAAGYSYDAAAYQVSYEVTKGADGNLAVRRLWHRINADGTKTRLYEGINNDSVGAVFDNAYHAQPGLTPQAPQGGGTTGATPQTNDDSLPVGLSVGLGLAAVAVIVVAIVLRRRKG
ncbi:InlB B-repeat-containing protein [Olsenella sp. HMSC062G07]|uniref:InlB B-repeat-containing protein n=1 Tax=Olsenella sp. HMSC062G07 TaxID=1739330 RepID=UPI0008A51089|nr:InlB B-repeat-containing protein [Olsenella sp. HMSC062G07]OFK22455.1 hypothetical protein HMPREF2826_01545 [Olsenella sp. HMSC062G07]